MAGVKKNKKVARFLILSNGHGEDLSGSLLALQLIKSGNIVAAFPLVGKGNNYKKNKINIIGRTKEFKTGGLGYTSLKGRISELCEGQLIYLLRRLFLLLSIRKNYEYFLVVGDSLPIAFASISNKPFFVYLVAYSSHYEGRLNLPWPCSRLLKSNQIKKIYSRDYLTSEDLTRQLKRDVKFLGNPFMDITSSSKKYLSSGVFNIAFFPCSRAHELINNFLLMLDLLASISTYEYFKDFEFEFALVDALNKKKLLDILKVRKWKYLENFSTQTIFVFQFRMITVKFIWNSFERILNDSNLVVSMAGTATEQAIGLIKPVIQLEGEGPQFTKSFAEAQRRLLGKYVFCSTKYFNRQEQIKKTLELLLKVIYMMRLDINFLKKLSHQSKIRLGEKGSSLKIAKDMNSALNNENK